MKHFDKGRLTLVEKDCAQYFTTRLCEKDSDICELLKIKKIIIYAGEDPQKFDVNMQKANARYIAQKGSMEHIWETEPGVLALPVFHGFSRLDRYLTGIKHLNNQGKRIFGERYEPIQIEVRHINNTPLDTELKFNSLRLDWVKRVESNKDVLGKYNPRDINRICIGSYYTLSEILDEKGIKHEEHKDDYLDYIFFEYDGKPVLATKTMYGDLIGNALSDLILRQRLGGKHRDFDVYTVTKAGGLAKGMQRGDIAIPTAYTSERYLLKDRSKKLFRSMKEKFKNKLTGSQAVNDEINGISVISDIHSLVALSSAQQYIDILDWAHELGCKTVEMELGAGQLAVKKLNESHYDLNLSLNNLFVISDLPRFGDSLANENWDNKRFNQGITKGYEMIFKQMKEN